MNTLRFFILFAITVSLHGCGVYSFTGAAIAPEVKTVSVDFFPNRASTVQPALSQTFTEKLRDKFVSQTNLTMTTARGDLSFEGQITDYVTQPIAIQGNDQAALNRLTITVKVKFENAIDSKQNFESSFARYSDYDSRQPLSSVELDLINEICNQLVDDIFNKAVINW
jgi:outer membrane lipopolysaccharide assembly protein LptE/RlpB